MNQPKAANRYAAAAASSAVQNASPHQLISLLYARLQKDLQLAIYCTDHHEDSKRHGAISHALEVVSHLDATIDLEKGGDVAKGLRDLYTWMQYALPVANLNRDSADLKKALDAVAKIAGAWNELSNGQADGQ